MATRRRTTMYSTGGKKLYAVRNADGSFKDIQSYARAHRMDIARQSADEVATAVKKKAASTGKAVKKAAKKAVRKATKKVAAASKAVRKTARKVVKKTAARKAAKKAVRKSTRR